MNGEIVMHYKAKIEFIYCAMSKSPASENLLNVNYALFFHSRKAPNTASASVSSVPA